MAGNKGIVSAQFYKFSAANKTITFSNDYAGLDLGEITYITNIKNGVATVIYDPFDATKGGTLSGLTLTLAYDTSLMADTDPLQIITGFTPLNADPTPVRIVANEHDEDQTELLQTISDNIDLLSRTVDRAEGIEVNTRDVSIKKDSDGAIIPSDNVEIPGKILRLINESLVVETTGYNTVVFVVPPSTVTTGISITIEASVNLANWQAVHYAYNITNGNAPVFNQGGAASTVSIAANNEYHFTVPAISRYLRFRLTGGSGGVIRPFALLKSIPFYPPTVNTSGNTNTNIATIAGTAPSLNTVSSNGGSSAFNGGISVAGFLSHVTANTLSPASQVLPTAIPNALGIGGREAPYVGQYAGLLRYFTLDARGNLILGGDTAFRTPNLGGALEQSSAGTSRGIGGVFNNIQGAQSLTVVDTNQSEGDTDNMLLKQILQELKILNQQFTELPNIINQANYPISDPQEYRNDNSTTQF